MGMLKITLKAARVNAGLTQRKAAELLKVSLNVVSNWERYITYPDALIIPKIEAIYNISYADIIFLPQYNALSVVN